MSDFEVREIKIGEENYPPLLREIPKAPEILYARGNAALDAEFWARPLVAIVGTRKATNYGLKVARELARELAARGVVVVSGLAFGIDAAAHRGALEASGTTLAILGSGVNQLYPTANADLARELMDRGGAVLSEFAPDFPPDKWTFPQRNRIVAGLTQATIVIEAPEKSGALITAYLALDFNREVGAVPGEITSVNSTGTNALLRRGAALIRNADDVFELLGEIRSEDSEQATLFDNCDEIEQIILQCLIAPKSREALTTETSLPAETLGAKLTMLELKGAIENKNGLFRKIL
ncbi:MAG: DNA-protecting protein DprA [Candidatus Niyogibacteria bacterium]|nr:DNA-protecting protein DprA [Candidatus Niyogibacteria bacterium]